MKAKFILVALSFILCLSCAGTKQVASNSPQRPSRTLRTTEPCIELANEDSNFMRAYGTATSYVEKTALNEAERDARNRLANMIQVAVEGAAQDHEKNATSNLKSTSQAIGEAVMTQYVSEVIKNTKILKTNIYDLTDGSIQVYVCLEMKVSKNDFEKGVDKALSDNEVMKLEHDRERFIEKMQKGLEEYKKSKMN